MGRKQVENMTLALLCYFKLGGPNCRSPTFWSFWGPGGVSTISWYPIIRSTMWLSYFVLFEKRISRNVKIVTAQNAKNSRYSLWLMCFSIHGFQLQLNMSEIPHISQNMGYSRALTGWTSHDLILVQGRWRGHGGQMGLFWGLKWSILTISKQGLITCKREFSFLQFVVTFICKK